MKKRHRYAVGLALVALGGCRDVTGPPQDLAAARRRWSETRPAAYRLTLTVSCFCLFGSEPIVVDVRGDSVLSRRGATTGTPLDPRVAESFPTVDGLFAVLDRAIAQHAERLDAQYDATRGYPVRVSIDYRFQIADDEIGYTVVAFEPR